MIDGNRKSRKSDHYESGDSRFLKVHRLRSRIEITFFSNVACSESLCGFAFLGSAFRIGSLRRKLNVVCEPVRFELGSWKPNRSSELGFLSFTDSDFRNVWRFPIANLESAFFSTTLKSERVANCIVVLKQHLWVTANMVFGYDVEEDWKWLRFPIAESSGFAVLLVRCETILPTSINRN